MSSHRSFRLLISGTRDFGAWQIIDRALAAAHNEARDLSLFKLRPTLIIEGGQRGIDTAARFWAQKNHIWFMELTADWETYGRAAGCIRNDRMISDAHPDAVLAIPGPKSRGTWNMVELAEKLCIPYYTYRELLK